MMSDVPTPTAQFWLLTGEVPCGPFTVAQVHAELAAGRATWQTPACPVGGSTWLPLVQTAGIGPPVPPRAVPGTSPPVPTDLSAPLSPAPAISASLGGVFGARSPLDLSGSSASSVAAASPPSPAPAATDPNGRPDPVVARTAPTEPGRPARSNRFWLRVGGETTGPFRAAHVRAKVQAGEVPPDAQARRDGTDEWVPLAEAVGTLPPRPPAGAQTAMSAVAAVEVRAATAGAAPLPAATPPKRSVWDTEAGRLWSTIGGFVLLTVLFGFFKGCREDAQKNRPPMKEIMQNARDKNR